MGIEILPNELLSSIFLLSSLSKGSPHSIQDYLRVSTPFAVSLVSRRWRQVAISFPELWSYVDITAADGPLFEKIALMLERCRSHPVDLVIHHVRIADIEQVIGLIVPRASYWRRFYLFAGEGISVTEFISELNRLGHADLYVPLLQFAHLSNESRWCSPRDPPIRFQSPSLRQLSLDGSYDISKQWLFDFSNLTILDIGWHVRNDFPDNITFDDVVDLLKQVPLLQDLSITLKLWHQIPRDVLPGHRSFKQLEFSVELPNLVSLAFAVRGGWCSENWMWLIHINCPQLSSLDLVHLPTITGHGHVEHEILSALTGRLPMLKTFNWDPVQSCPNTLLYIFEVVPSISHLVIHLVSQRGIDYLNVVKELLQQHHFLCPMLEQISLEAEGISMNKSKSIPRIKRAGKQIARLIPSKKLQLSITDSGVTRWEMEFDLNGLGDET